MDTAKRLGAKHKRVRTEWRSGATEPERESVDGSSTPSLVPFYGYLGLGLLACFVYFLIPTSIQDQANDLIGLSGVAAIIVGARRNEPRAAHAWHLMALGQFLFVLGDIIWTVYEVVLHRESPFPSVADISYLGGYIPLAAGLVLVVGARLPGRDIWTLSDGAIIAVAAGVGSWIFLMAPLAAQSNESALGTSVSLAYPLADVLMIALAASLVFTANTRSASYWLIGVSLLALIVADTAYIPATLSNSYHSGSPIDAGWTLSYVLWGAAALHPSMKKLTESGHAAQNMGFSVRRLIAEGVAIAAIPMMFAIQILRHGPKHSTIVVFGLAIASLLIVGRKAVLVAALDKAALHDPLTGLPNRRLLLDRLGQAFRAAERSGQPVGVIFLDLGGFKSVNDRFGHEAGDDALIAIGGRIKRQVRASDTVARYGGDEFVVVAEGIEWMPAEVLVDRIRSAISAPLEVRGSWVEIAVDIGVAVEHSPRGSDDATELLGTADRAMYRAKAAARDRG